MDIDGRKAKVTKLDIIQRKLAILQCMVGFYYLDEKTVFLFVKFWSRYPRFCVSPVPTFFDFFWAPEGSFRGEMYVFLEAPH